MKSLILIASMLFAVQSFASELCFQNAEDTLYERVQNRGYDFSSLVSMDQQAVDWILERSSELDSSERETIKKYAADTRMEAYQLTYMAEYRAAVMEIVFVNKSNECKISKRIVTYVE